MKEFEISSREAGQRMDKYLFKVLDRASKGFVYKMLRKKNIVLNDKKAGGQEILSAGDHIKLYLSDETFSKFASEGSQTHDPEAAETIGDPKAASRHGNANTAKRAEIRPTEKHPVPEIIYEDDDILIINKPAGMLSQKASAGDYSANEMIIDYLLDSGQLTPEELRTFHPSVCNRLDRNTSGLLAAGKTMRGLQEMNRLLRSRTVRKYYRCLVWGDVREDAYLDGYLIKDRKTNKVTICATDPERGGGRQKSGADAARREQGASRIETAYHPLRHYGKITLLEVHLITGRSHQIRAHLASIGHPVLGDAKYGNADVNRRLYRELGVKGQLLHAYRMELPDGRSVTADMPEIFERVCRSDVFS